MRACFLGVYASSGKEGVYIPTMKRTLSLMLLCLVATGAFAQSRTEEARKRMKGESDDVSSSLVIGTIELFIDVAPELFYFRRLEPTEQRLGYTPHPYSAALPTSGIRTFDNVGPVRSGMLETRLHLSLPQGSLAMEQRAADVKWHIGYWQVFGQYEYLKELAAPYGIHQFNLMVGRKMRFFSSAGDAGVSMGYRNVMIGGDRFDGFEMAWHADLYPVKPFSFSYYGGVMPHTYGSVTNQRISVGLHRGPVRFAVGHHWLDIAGVGFNTFNAGLTVYL